MSRRFATLAIKVAIFGSLLAGGAQVRSTGAPQALKLSFQPYAGEQHEVMPVEVLKFVVDVPADAVVDGNMFVHEWRLRNRSDKSVVRIRGALFVYGESEPEKLLLKYPDIHLGGVKLSPGQSWPRAACVGYWCPNEFGTHISARKLLQPLFNEKEPEGAYIIAMGIDKVWFADGTTWELETAKTN